MTQMSYYLIVFSVYFLGLSVASKHTQITKLKELTESRRSENPPQGKPWTEQDTINLNPLHIVPQQGSKEADRIDRLPGQPQVDFDHYSGYVTVDSKDEKALFYYFAESPPDSLTKPLVLWLNGGPGCSSFGYGAMEELGPFRVNSDGKTLYRNDFAWNNVANVLFLDSPAGVGFSYSNTSSGRRSGDKRASKDSYTFLINWLERFPQYKSRRFFITGESYAGHYVPQLASLILSENKKANKTIINFHGIAIGNACIDDLTWDQGTYDYWWAHALNSDETITGIKKYCDNVSGDFPDECSTYLSQASLELGLIDIYNIYAPICDDMMPKPAGSIGSVENFDPCTSHYVESYLNRAEVQEALHARNTSWLHCRGLEWADRPTTILPTITQLIENGISVWIYSGDTDGLVPVTSSRYAINKLKLPVETAWRPWYYNKREVGGYVVGYKGVVFATVRGAGHAVPSYQPERALVMISSFLQGKLPPSWTK